MRAAIERDRMVLHDIGVFERRRQRAWIFGQRTPLATRRDERLGDPARFVGKLNGSHQAPSSQTCFAGD
jgi:hypothetical protein